MDRIHAVEDLAAMEEEYQDLLMATVAYNNLLHGYKEKLQYMKRPLPSIPQRWENNIPRIERLLKENNEKKTALRQKILELEERA